MVLSLLFGCGNAQEETKNNITELTVDNYSKYLDITTQLWGGGEWQDYMGGFTVQGENVDRTNNEGDIRVEVAGVSSNYDYNDVKIEGTIKIKYRELNDSGATLDDFYYVPREIEHDFSIELNIAGDGKYQNTLRMGKWVITDADEKGYELELEIKNISGNVQRM